jgi:amino acid transporter
MATTQPDQRGELLSERVSGGMLPRVLNTFDMVAIFVSIVLFITNAAVIQSAGPAAFGWWIIGFLAFLIPGAIVTGQLGRMFPGEGSIYLWTQKAFGPFWGFFAGFCAWWPGVLVMVATGTVVLSYLGFVLPSTVGSASVQVQGTIIIAFILLSAVLANQRFRLTQNIVNAVFVLYGAAILVVFVAGLVHLATGGAAATDPTDWSAWAPSSDTGLNLANWSFFGLVILALLGVEVPLNMGVEIKHERSITRYLLWGSLAVMLAYLLATWAVMVTVPAANGQSAQVTALATAVGAELAGWLGNVVAVILAGFFLFITVVYNYSFARLVFVSGLDQKLPSAMARVNKHKVPSNAVWVQTVIACLFTLVAFILLPSFGIGGGRPIDIQTKVYDVLQAAVTVIWCISMVVLFIDVVIIIRRFLPRYQETRLAHPVVFYVCAVLGVLSTLVGVIATLSGSWTPLISNDSGSVSIAGAHIAYGSWFYLVAGIAVLSLLVSVAIYWLGRATHARAAGPAAPTGTLTPGHP